MCCCVIPILQLRAKVIKLCNIARPRTCPAQGVLLKALHTQTGAGSGHSRWLCKASCAGTGALSQIWTLLHLPLRGYITHLRPKTAANRESWMSRQRTMKHLATSMVSGSTWLCQGRATLGASMSMAAAAVSQLILRILMASFLHIRFRTLRIRAILASAN